MDESVQTACSSLLSGIRTAASACPQTFSTDLDVISKKLSLNQYSHAVEVYYEVSQLLSKYEFEGSRRLNTDFNHQWEDKIRPLIDIYSSHPNSPVITSKPSMSPPQESHEESETGFEGFKRRVMKTDVKTKMSSEMINKCNDLVVNMMSLPSFVSFVTEEDWDSFQDYRKVIEKPTSLKTLQKDLLGNKFSSFENFVFELRMIFSNSFVYFFNDKFARKKALQALDLCNNYLLHDLMPTLVKDLGKNQQNLLKTLKPKLDARREIKECRFILVTALERPSAFYFVRPIDKYDIILPNYDELVKKRMDLSTVAARLLLNFYSSNVNFMNNLRLVYNNCITYYSAMGKGQDLIDEAKNTLRILNNQAVKRLSQANLTKEVKVLSKPVSQTKSSSNAGASSATKNVLADLNVAMTDNVLARCQKITNRLMKDKNCVYFLEPVNYVALNLPDYPQVVTQPMDLGTVKWKLQNQTYSTVQQFVNDVNLVFSNCLLYNKVDYPHFPIRKMCKAATAKFAKSLKELGNAFLNGDLTKPVPSSSSKKLPTVSHSKLKKLLETLIQSYISKGTIHAAESNKFSKISERLLMRKYSRFAQFCSEVSRAIDDSLVDADKQQEEDRLSQLKVMKETFGQTVRFIENDIIQASSSGFDREKVKISYTDEVKKQAPCVPISPPVMKVEIKKQIPKPPAPPPPPPPVVKIKQNSEIKIKAPAAIAVPKPRSDSFVKREQSSTTSVKTIQAKETKPKVEASQIKTHTPPPPPPPKTISKQIPKEKTPNAGVSPASANRYGAYLSGEIKKIPTIKVSTTAKPKIKHKHKTSDAKPSTPKLKIKTKQPPPPDLKPTVFKLQTPRENELIAPRPGPFSASADFGRHSLKTNPISSQISISNSSVLKAKHHKTQSAFKINVPKKKMKDGKHQAEVPASGGAKFFTPPTRLETLSLKGFALSVEKVLQKLSKHDFSKFYFGIPVLEAYTDPVFQKNYKSVIQEPMDLFTVFTRLYYPDQTRPIYKEANDVLLDVELIFSNAITFNSLNDESDEAAKMTKLSAEHMSTYAKHLFAEREADFRQQVYIDLLIKLVNEKKIAIDYDQLYCFCFQGRNPETKQLIDPEMDKYNRPPISALKDKTSEEYLNDVNLFLYLEYDDVVNLNALSHGQIMYTSTGPVPSEEKILWDERKRRKARTKLRRQREKLLEDKFLYESKILASTDKLLAKVTHPNKRAMNNYFMQPFDWQRANLLTYPEIIRNPMDFQTVKNNLNKGHYNTLKEFIADVRLIFENCLTFTRTNANGFNIELRRRCIQLSNFFEKHLAELTLSLLDRTGRKRADEDFGRFQKKLQSRQKKEEEAREKIFREKLEKQNAMLMREQNPNAIFQPTRVSSDGFILKTKLNKHTLEKQRRIALKRKQKQAEMKLFRDTNVVIELAESRAESKERKLKPRIKIPKDRENSEAMKDFVDWSSHSIELNLKGSKMSRSRRRRRPLSTSIFKSTSSDSDSHPDEAELLADATSRKRKASELEASPILDSAKKQRLGVSTGILEVDLEPNANNEVRLKLNCGDANVSGSMVVLRVENDFAFDDVQLHELVFVMVKASSSEYGFEKRVCDLQETFNVADEDVHEIKCIDGIMELVMKAEGGAENKMNHEEVLKTLVSKQVGQKDQVLIQAQGSYILSSVKEISDECRLVRLVFSEENFSFLELS